MGPDHRRQKLKFGDFCLKRPAEIIFPRSLQAFLGCVLGGLHTCAVFDRGRFTMERKSSFAYGTAFRSPFAKSLFVILFLAWIQPPPPLAQLGSVIISMTPPQSGS